MYPRMTDMAPAPDNLLKMDWIVSVESAGTAGTACYNSRVTQEDDSEEEL